MSLRTYLRLSSAAVVGTAVVVFAGPAVADAFRPTSGDVTVDFDSCGRPTVIDFDGDRWVSNDTGERRLRFGQARGHVETDGDEGTLTLTSTTGATLSFAVARNGFRNADACI